MAETLTIRTASSTEIVKIAVPGPQGPAGQGVPVGGSTGQVLRKASGSNYDTEWAEAGSGSGSVTSVALASSDLTITGSPITSSGTITANIAANAVTLEKLQTISSEHLLGRHGNGNGGVQQIGLGTGLAMSGSNVRVATTGITAGTYTKLTIDETGRATVGATATPQDIGAAGAWSQETITLTGDTTLSSARAKQWRVNSNSAVNLTLPTTGVVAGDEVEIEAGTLTQTLTITNDGTPVTFLIANERKTFRNYTGLANGWDYDVPIIPSHVHGANDIVFGTFDIGRIPTGTSGTTVALGNHGHGNINSSGQVGSTSGLPLVTTTAGAVTTLALGTANQVLRVNSGATGVEFADPAAAGVTSVTGTAPIVSSGGTTPAISVTVGTTANTVCAGDDARLSNARTPTAHTHPAADISDSTTAGRALLTAADAAAQRTALSLAASATTDTTNASNITSGTLGTARLSVGTTTGTVAAGDDSRFHTRSHAITSTSDHTASNWSVFYSNGSGQVTELALGAANTVLTSNGASSAPSFAAAASGGTKTYAVFTAEHNQPPATAFATLDTRNSIAVLDFDAAADENAVFAGIMPEAASLGSGLIVRLHWMATTATSGNVRWGVQFERSNTDLDSDSFDTAVEATAATNGTSGIITTTAITVTTIDGITAGDVFRLKVFRNADDATNDTMTGDAELVAVEVRSAA